MTSSPTTQPPSPGTINYECEEDIRVDGYDPLISPLLLRSEIPTSQTSKKIVGKARKACADVISGKDHRLIVVVGPCSIHDTDQALQYARLLLPEIKNFPDLVIIMRSYFEKPRTTVGWKGLINDPDLDGSCKINKGMRKARELLNTLTDMGIPVGVELLDTIRTDSHKKLLDSLCSSNSPQFLSDLISWGAIGARTTESQLHRELASGTSHPIGFKNGTQGDLQVAIDAIRAAVCPHAFLGVNDQGLASIVKTIGNPDVHVILRGGKVPNYEAQFVKEARDQLLKARPAFHPAIMIDCSHGNSQKDHRNQSKVVNKICEQLIDGDQSIVGVMIESHINEGRQDVPIEGPSALKPGVSITDACVNFKTTIEMLNQLQVAVVKRKEVRSTHTNGYH
ncbi:uncharacterized protein MELLADRAFT_88008 [Melampsora larici-populina 98AG31]|uniref:Phospho-2-dehydro-3-deoxyheptonate aldolase n=1 Tax=Melampsora larici-populina (strain 98AG31 / pathotype 3-4-7) TaxID=747676 RepID=F4RQ33_MELLP|nr:uncharacterized protein MELLADRAFT_88008 [Melampsora larici-populina 98AG31]EGG05338.1 hypothetical protein MELLADRAFT_88008 [Melampsora larici-populina 98AG31]